MIVLGIDPGTAAVGYGIVEGTGNSLRAVDYGVLRTSPDLAMPERLLAVHRLVVELIELHAPAVIGVERLFFSSNVQTALAVGQSRGVILLAAAQYQIPVREATPSEVKTAIAGHGVADKEQVGRMVRRVLDMAERPTPDDAADALAMAIFVANTERSARLARSAIADRAASAPIERRETPYERAVREAIALERSSGSSPDAGPAPVRAARPAQPGRRPL